MTSDFITKRAHKKSRGGCKTCKTKKIKCDEAHPKCSYCEKRELQCDYTARPIRTGLTSPPNSRQSPVDTPSPDFSSGNDAGSAWALVQSLSPKVNTSSGTLTPLHLKAMHFWSSFTSKTIAPGSQSFRVLEVTIPQLAFEHEYLLNLMLGISSLHMQGLVPDPKEYRKETALYRSKALGGFRQALSNINPNDTQEWQAALVTSILFSVLCGKDYCTDGDSLTCIHWLTFYRGLSTIISLRSFPEVMGTEVAPIFRRSINELQTEPVVPFALAKMLSDIDPLDPDFEYLTHYTKTLDLLGILYASLQQDGLTLAFRTRIISWCSFASHEFTKIAREKRPRALVILAHFMVFVKTMTMVWWVDGCADQDISKILSMVSPEWYPLLDVPLQALSLTDPNDLSFLLLLSVDENLSPVLKTSPDEYTEAVNWFKPTNQTPATNPDPTHQIMED